MRQILSPATFENPDSMVDRAWSLLIRWLLESGPPSRLEGRLLEDGELEWRRVHRQQVETQSMPGRIFRPLMARLAVVTGADDPYGSVVSFSWEENGRSYYLRAFFCNEPSMDFWLRLYLHGASQDLASDFAEVRFDEN